MVVLNPAARNLNLLLSEDRKIFEHGCKGSSTKYDLDDLSLTSVHEFFSVIQEGAKEGAWGKAVTEAPVTWNGNDVSETANIIEDFRRVTEAQIITSSGARLGCTFEADGITHDFTSTESNDDDENGIRVKMIMIGHFLMNSLTSAGKATLLADKEKFEYLNHDGTVVNDGITMLLIILQKILPSTKVGISASKTEIRTASPKDFDGDFGKLLTHLKGLKNEIERQEGKDYSDFGLYLIEACERTNDTDMKEFMKELRNDWELDIEPEKNTSTELMNRIKDKWTNVTAKRKKEAAAKVAAAKTSSGDSSKSGGDTNVKMIALFTHALSSIKTLSEQVQALQKSNNGSTGSSSSGDNSNNRQNGMIAEWRKSKDFGDKVVKDGKTYHWCMQHQGGKGLYVTHHPEDHGKHPSKWTHTNPSGGTKTASSSASDASSKLQLTEKMKSALTSNGFSLDDAKSLLESMENDGSGTMDFCNGFIRLIDRWPTFLDHFLWIEIPGWVHCIVCFLSLRRIESTAAIVHLWQFCVELLYPTRPRQRHLKNFEGTIEAYPICQCMYSHYMLSMWFAHLIGASIFSSLFARIADSTWTNVLTSFQPPYDYVAKRQKKPPDGLITATVVLCIMIVLNIFMFIRGLYLIWYFTYQMSNTQDHKNAREMEMDSCFSSIEIPSILSKAFSSSGPRDSVSFDSDGLSIVLDNSATCHICNDKSLFISPIQPLSKSDRFGVNTAGGMARPIGYGTIRISWTDDCGRLHKGDIDDVLYFPKSPVNIIGITKLGIQNNDPEGTYILTKAHYSVFTWGHEKYRRTVNHHSSGLPELPINQGCSKFKAFFSAFHSVLPLMRATKSCLISEQNPSSKDATNFSFASRSMSDGTIIIGDPVGFTQSGSIKKGIVKDVVFDEKMLPMYKVELQNGSVIETRRENLKRRHEPDVGIIPRTTEHLKIDSHHLHEDDLSCVLCPQVLTPDEQEFMHWHHRLHHLSSKHMMRLARAGILPKKFLNMKRIPKCASCAFGQAHRRSWRTKGSTHGHIRSDDEIRPGDGVSTDQLVSAQPGLVPQVSGNLTSDRITGATVFVDHVTRYVHVHLMRDLTLDSTLEAKAACEKVFADFGHKIRHYRADNGRYADKEFMADIHRCNQRISFCGVGAHHQNAIAERGIKELTLIARTILLHANRHWPEYISTMLWPLALKTAADRMNRLSVNDQLDSPLSLMSGSKNLILPSDHHTWGCPVYVLDSDLQSSGIGPPKWDPRSRLGIYVGRSPFHAGSVALVLNPTTGHISPQYHVIFDDDFTTIPYLRSGGEPNNWDTLFRTSCEKVTDESYELAKTWMSSPLLPPAHDNEGPSDSEGDTDCVPTPRIDNTSKRGSNVSSPTSNVMNESASIGQRGRSQMPSMINLESSGLRRSSRSSTTPQRFGFFSKYCLLTSAALIRHRALHPSCFVTRVMNQIEKVNLNFDGTLNHQHPFAFAAALADNEVYTFKEMLDQPDVSNFVTAMVEEVLAHEKNEHWEVVPRSEAEGHKTILAIWSFKRKRFPDGTINKWKARLCAHGGMQQWGVNYWETYAPVVNWISVRTLLAISIMNDLPTTAIDFVLAFPQATLGPEERIFMELPAGMSLPHSNPKGYVLRLKKNLYGLKQAGLNWFEYLKEGLEERGFTQSQVDPCVFFCRDVIIVLYVDDCIVMSKNPKTVDGFVESLSTGQDPDNPKRCFKNKYSLTNDGGIKNYLGVEVVKHEKNNAIELKQKFLIECILKAVDLDKEITSASKPTPVIKPLLHKDLAGLPRKYDWNYRSLVGMLGYLQGSTRPDISMATHQCARFNNNPKLSHERSVRRIAKYLLGTQDRGIVFNPDLTKGIECFVDADFSGNWNAIDSEDPENVLSRTGYIIYYGGCPIHWSSRLQSEITLSTAESEYVALSQAMRDVIPLMNLLKEFGEIVPVTNVPPEIKCKVFEDNTSCIAIAKAPSMTPRTKHIALKYHFFRSHVMKGSISIHSISTSEQTADILTKPLSGELFEYLRNKIMGW